uniref:PIN domain n=1 Tax=Candidatus Kentrum sp. UNK TaxID=2126344 RepID=A0A451ARY3_9GAMM|nr:MAG: PIN domain [Candidatus Kentron sp. UNK]VFK73726.1 MAG: PIN domain [Candidatus Kentron sp. UNK]
MSQSVYIETSVVSYCAARPSTHIITAAKQAITRTWWEQESPRFSLYISTVVEREASRGDPGAARKRIELIHHLPLLAITAEVEELALHLVEKHLLPTHSEEDALHIAIASVHGMNYLLTWNFKHINNAETKAAIASNVQNAGYRCPIICSPEELGGIEA